MDCLLDSLNVNDFVYDYRLNQEDLRTLLGNQLDWSGFPWLRFNLTGSNH